MLVIFGSLSGLDFSCLLVVWRLAVPQFEVKYQKFSFAFFMPIHIGHIIRQEMERQERTPAWLARKINCQRPNVYYIYSQPSINTDILLKISQVLGVDFFAFYTELLDK